MKFPSRGTNGQDGEAGTVTGLQSEVRPMSSSVAGVSAPGGMNILGSRNFQAKNTVGGNET